MVWDVSEWESVLRTDYVSGMPKEVLRRRSQLINEAIGWEGSIEHPMQHEVGRSTDGSSLFFMKPGKEAVTGTNENDMRPMIIINGRPIDPPSFSFIWSDLTNIAIADFEAFRAVLLLIYRSAYLLDHRTNEDGCLRYSPGPIIVDCVAKLDASVGNNTRFGSVDGLLRFIDLLGWNEDIKYHSFERRGSFTEGKYAKNPKIGRVNTLLTCIRIPFEISVFMRDYRNERSDGGTADFVKLYDIMQALINSRGICTPRKRSELFEYLSPYLVESGSGHGQVTIGPLQRTLL
jgi:hypothetical protein